MSRGITERLAIAGGGAIATGLARLAARQGEVTLLVRSERSAERARAALGEGVEVVSDVDALSGTTFAIEAVIEDLEAKVELIGRLGRVLGPDALIATCTSSLPMVALAAASARPDRFAAFHVFNPVERMELVELTFPREATDETRRRVNALCAGIGKTAVEVPDVPGFVVNRLLFPYLFGAVRLLEETGMAPADLDRCMTLGAGHPMGPLALLDLVGLDVAVAIGESIGAEVPARLRSMVADGRLGRKAGGGFF